MLGSNKILIYKPKYLELFIIIQYLIQVKNMEYPLSNEQHLNYEG